MTIFGTALNGKRVQVEFGSYKGLAAVRERDGFTEVAYRGAPPAEFPCVGKIDREVAQAVSLRGPHVKVGDLVVLIIR